MLRLSFPPKMYSHRFVVISASFGSKRNHLCSFANCCPTWKSITDAPPLALAVLVVHAHLLCVLASAGHHCLASCRLAATTQQQSSLLSSSPALLSMPWRSVVSAVTVNQSPASCAACWPRSYFHSSVRITLRCRIGIHGFNNCKAGRAGVFRVLPLRCAAGTRRYHGTADRRAFGFIIVRRLAAACYLRR